MEVNNKRRTLIHSHKHDVSEDIIDDLAASGSRRMEPLF